MNYSKEKPRADGWYWVRRTLLGQRIEEIHYLYDEGIGMRYVVSDDIDESIDEFEDAEFSGQIPPPDKLMELIREAFKEGCERCGATNTDAMLQGSGYEKK